MSTADIYRHRAAVRHPEFPGEFALRPLDVSADLDLVHAWMNDPEVARFWLMPWAPDRIAEYLRRQDASAHSRPCVGELAGVGISYWELYRADLDPLARHYPARDHDAGFHMLLGPARFRGRGLTVSLVRTVSAWQLAADPLAERVLAEPDVNNTRAVRVLEQAGFHRAMEVDLPNKRAALMIRDREG